jgi:hypothetical protein
VIGARGIEHISLETNTRQRKMTNQMNQTNKEELVKPKTIVRHGAYGKIDFFCPSCMQLLGKHYKVCPKCGQALKWKHESTQKT